MIGSKKSRVKDELDRLGDRVKKSRLKDELDRLDRVKKSRLKR